MDCWLNKLKNTVRSSSNTNEEKCIAPTNSASFKRANSPSNKQSDTIVSKNRKM